MIEYKSPSYLNAGLWAAWSCDEAVREYSEIRWDKPESRAEAQKWIDSLEAKLSFAIIKEGVPVGAVWAIPVSHRKHAIFSPAIIIRDSDAWGKGVGTTSIKFLMVNIRARLWIGYTYGNNHRMQRVFEKCGYERVCEISEYYVFGDGYATHQTWLMRP